MIEETLINIRKGEEITDIRTNGFLLLYMENDRIKSCGDIELKALAPLLMRVAMQKMEAKFTEKI